MYTDVAVLRFPIPQDLKDNDKGILRIERETYNLLKEVVPRLPELKLQFFYEKANIKVFVCSMNGKMFNVDTVVNTITKAAENVNYYICPSESLYDDFYDWE